MVLLLMVRRYSLHPDLLFLDGEDHLVIHLDVPGGNVIQPSFEQHFPERADPVDE